MCYIMVEFSGLANFSRGSTFFGDCLRFGRMSMIKARPVKTDDWRAAGRIRWPRFFFISLSMFVKSMSASGGINFNTTGEGISTGGVGGPAGADVFEPQLAPKRRMPNIATLNIVTLMCLKNGFIIIIITD